MGQSGRQAPAERRRDTVATLVGALGVTLFSLVFIASFIGALHKPGPRGVPVGIVGVPSSAASLSAALGREVPGGFTVTSYPTEQAARTAILDRGADAALVPGRPQRLPPRSPAPRPPGGPRARLRRGAAAVRPSRHRRLGHHARPVPDHPVVRRRRRALLPGAALPAVQNIVYFSGNAIGTQLAVLSAWAAAGAIALALAMFVRRSVPVPAPRPPADDAAAAARGAPQHGRAGS